MVEFVDISGSSKRLKDVGIPEAQAECIVEVMTETFSRFTDTLVTRDFLDMRLMEQQANMDAKLAAIDKRFLEMEQLFLGVDKQFSSVETRFSQIDSELVRMSAATDIGFSRLENRINILFLLVGLVLTVQVIPTLKTLFTG